MTPDRPDPSPTVSETTETGSACGASDLAASRRQLLSDGKKLSAAELRHEWLDLHETWLTAKATEIGITDGSGFAVVGIGGLARRELVPYSDLDLILLHDNVSDDVLRQVADRLWYPLWDANVRLDHSVRTVPGTLEVANADLTAALGLLEARHIAGEERLSADLIDGVRRQWRSGIRSRMDELVEMTLCPLAAVLAGRTTSGARPEIGSRRPARRPVA